MKKLLLSLMLTLLAFASSWATAPDVTFIPGEDNSTTSTLSKGGVTLVHEISQGSFDKVSYYQCRKSATFEVRSTISSNISEIKFTCTAENYPASGFTISDGNGNYYTEGLNGTWTGNQKSITFTATNNEVRMTKIEVTFVNGKTVTSLSFDEKKVTAYLDALNEYEAPVLTKNPTDLAVTYSIAGDEVGTLATDGTLAINAVGTAVVTASYAGNDNYTASSASYTIKVLAQKPTYLFYESFNTNDKTGGNDGTWSRIGGGTTPITSDNEGWENVNGAAASHCARYGATSNLGSATTPAFNVGGISNLKITFKAGAWNGSSEKTTLKLSTVGGGTLDKTEVTLVKGQWSDYTVYVTNATSATKIKFEGAQAKNSRFFLDEVYVYEYVAPAAPTCNLTLNEEVDDEEYIDLLDENEYACIDGVYYANVVSLTDNNGYVNTGIEITTNSVTYTRKNIDSDKWHAVCLPFDVPASDWKTACGYSVIKLHETQEEENAVVFEYLADDADMLANTPYLIKDNEEWGEISLSATDVVLGEAIANVEHEGKKISMVGTFENITLQNTAEVSYYALKEGVFTTVKEGHSINLKPFRAYLQVKANTPGTLNIRIHDTEGIQSIEAAQMEDGVFYNLQGIRVDKPTKGMYIFNGHKVILK